MQTIANADNVAGKKQRHRIKSMIAVSFINSCTIVAQYFITKFSVILVFLIRYSMRILLHYYNNREKQ